MDLFDLATTRLSTQKLVASKAKTAKDVVASMGAMQAQDFAMAKWAVGIRLPDSIEADVDSAIQKGDIIRVHLLRPTWHFVSSDDIYWMLDLTAPQIIRLLKTGYKKQELTDDISFKCHKIFEKVLSGGRHLSREELAFELTQENIITDGTRMSFIMHRAEVDKVICSGAPRGNLQTYALLQERVPNASNLTKEEALIKLASLYFKNHGPATIQDFCWWSGLLTRDAKFALEMIKPELISETINSKEYWFDGLPTSHIKKKSVIRLLPAFDEFLISYRDRSASLRDENRKTMITQNGLFRPVIVEDGQVIGIWKRTFKGNTVLVETQLFQPLTKSKRASIKKDMKTYSEFLCKKLEWVGMD